ncbi:MAG: patatin-like phospholipase family protein [Myxococcales bacterium]|nr:patatin-like phospholipase family protein [Myxococcales bacterium]MCB9708001.1 patatin-like phospholipase family protein [Myxococcales bacterium]
MAQDELALVVSGGGARAAYQVGFLRRLSREYPDLRIDILTGVSAGAINAAYLAAAPEPFDVKMERLAAVWNRLESRDVFKPGPASLSRQVLRWITQLASGGSTSVHRTRGLVDTSPLSDFLGKHLGAPTGPIPGIIANINNAKLKAVAITTASYATGRSVTWVQGRDIKTWERPHRTSVQTQLQVNHIMASTALPLFFPAVDIDGRWYGDGGIRQAAPFAPAVHLGARRILAISTRYIRTTEEAEEPSSEGYPPPAQVIGVLMNAIFLDLFDQDAQRLKRVNRLISDVPKEKRGTFRHIDLLVVRPSCDLGKLANDFEAKLPPAFRFLTRGLGTREVRANDALSMVMFQPDYLDALIRIGEQDAETRLSELHAFLNGG